MDISNTNPYAANKPATPPVDSTLLNNQNKEVTEPNPKATPSTQQAFEVNITQEAQDLLAAEATPAATPAAATPTPTAVAAPETTAPPSQDSGSNQSPVAAQAARQIVNIIA